jgi:rRNA maturation endonuclease Nob1
MGNERKEKEQEILAQMNEALEEQKAEETQKEEGMKLHCHKCGTLMENGKCPKCGHTVYVPMDEAKQKKIRLIVGAVFVVILVIVLVLTK